MHYSKLIHQRKHPVSKDYVLNLSLAFNALLVLTLMIVATKYHSESTASSSSSEQAGRLRAMPLKWNGGHPLDTRTGNCWCNQERYCMCTPSLAIDLIITSGQKHLWLVRRKDTSQLAVMGGFVMVGESTEDAVKRELLEEMNISLLAAQRPILFGMYADPRRDNRRHTASAVYMVHIDENTHPVAADDVKDVQRIALSEIEKYDFFADHKTILLDYRQSLLKNGMESGNSDVSRSLCTANR
jgi:8-oxo-dGTP diphosphatase